MRQLFAVLILCFSVVSAHAAELVWDAQTITSPLIVERSATQTGTYTTVATLPTGATRFILTPGAYGFYRVRNSAGPSNSVQFSADLYTGLVTDRLTALETDLSTLRARVATLENEAIRIDPVAPPSPYESVICYSTSLPGSRVICAPPPTITLTPGPVPPPPVPASNLTTRMIDADRIEIVGTGCTSLRTTGTGLRRIVECVH